ncbi:Polymyxin resistance protein ArnT [Minicystis rosea]|nr:Polymyxin resistance protein ArnT [Minicystis rosea]
MSDTQHTKAADDEGDHGGDELENEPAASAEPDRNEAASSGDTAKTDAEDESADGDEGEAGDDLEEGPLLPPGNPLRYIRGSIATLTGLFVAFCLMALKQQFRFGVPIAALAIFVATFGILDLIGSFDDPEDRVAGRATLRSIARPLGLVAGGTASLWGLICLAVDGRLASSSPILAAGVLIPASFLVTVVGVFQLGDAFGMWGTDPDGSPRPLLRRHGFWLVVTTTLLYLPTLGSHSLSDPWETHYGEVAREILSRNDWISTWWAQDGWFWSKPILDFWIQALAMATFGVRYGSNRMLSAVSEGRLPWPEWAVRLPVFLLTLIAVYLLYKAVSRAFGRRAGLLGGVVLLTMPQWFLLAHQTMTDMPFVAPLSAAMALFLIGAQEDPHDEVRVYELDLGFTRLRFSGFHLVMGAIVACALPQILYLVSRNVLLDIRGFHGILDQFSTGSPGNCGLPGNETCRAATPVLRGLHPALQALIWAQALALVLYMSWGERRRQRLFFLAAWLFAAIATMGKGPAGFGLPVLCALAYVAVTRRFRDLARMEITAGVLILCCVALPWFVAMYARHGQPFTDRLLFHDMFKRAFTHVHDTNEGDDVSFRFYVWQLGYAMFPWTGLVPAGLVWWLRRAESASFSASERDRKSDASTFLAMWFVFAFSLFSLMLTKFHHYILPAVPPAAMLVGVLLDALLARSLPAPSGPVRTPRAVALYALGIGIGVLVVIAGGARAFGGSIGGIGLALGGIGVLAVTVMLLDRAAPAGGAEVAAAADPEADATALFRQRFERVLLGAAVAAGAALVLAVGRDLSSSYEGVPSQIRLMHLITYNYRRPWPASLDFSPTLWAFTAAAAAATFMIAIVPLRRHVVSALLALGITFGAWGLGVYFMKISPHWGQRETTVAYYEAARENPGPFVAYQMNWKGENFYAGNHVPAFVSSGKRFQDYILDEKKKGTKTFYFVTEHGRTGTLQNELGGTKSFDKLTTPELDNKFVLVRARFE